MDEGIDAQRSMRADEPRLDPLDETETPAATSASHRQHPEVFRRVQRIRVHGCDIEESAIRRKPQAVRTGHEPGSAV